MRLYLDTEFNGFRGELISLALVPESGPEFYEVLPLPKKVHPWVHGHVIPFLYKEPVSREVFRNLLWAYMRQWSGQEIDIYADWPEDFAHLMSQLCDFGGMAPNFGGCSLHYIDTPPLYPVIPHNARSDAMALREWHTQAYPLTNP